MSWLLHISDLHLGTPTRDQKLDDDKTRFDGQQDLNTTQKVLRRTLRNLRQGFVKKHGKPEIVVVSGDLTNYASTDGFEAFTQLIDENGGILPDDRNLIVVVPGNHDVAWNEDVGSPARYAGFLSATREHGMATPFLDGVDFDPEDDKGTLFTTLDATRHIVVSDHFVVIPINSSNYCGTPVQVRGAWSRQDWQETIGRLPEPERAEASNQLDLLRRHDIARVSRPQLEVIDQQLRRLGEPRERRAGDRLRVAVIHHHLLPVSAREERRSFESLLNLGLVRDRLRDLEVDVVLHGHKHTEGVFWDLLSSPEVALNGATRRVLVVSAPGHFEEGAPVMRAIALDGSPLAPSVRISTFLGHSGGQSATRVAQEAPVVPLWVEAMGLQEQTRPIVQAGDAHVAYARLQALRALTEGDSLHNLLCVIESPAKSEELPPGYPEVAPEAQRWFEELISWWQLPDSELVASGAAPFNHGERIRRRWGDQVERAARLLDHKPTSSRAVVQLVDPGETGLADPEIPSARRFPAFVLVEFTIAERVGRKHLDCIGFFRKQELRYWWPVNVGELARLQHAVRELLTGPKPEVGRIATFSAIALWQDGVPRVAVSEIDRLVDSPDRLWSLAASIVHGTDASDEAREEWRRVLDDLVGIGRELPPQPRLGLDRLIEQLDRVIALRLPGNHAVAVMAALRAVADEHESRADQTLNQKGAKLVREAVGRLREAVDEAIGLGENGDDRALA